MNILYCGDGNITDGVIISAKSLAKCAYEPLHIDILTAGVKTKLREFTPMASGFAAFLEGELQKHNSKNTVRLFDITDLFQTDPPTANLETRFTPCCMLRLYADLLPQLPERLLYLDNDVICRKDPAEFYYQNLDKTELAGVLDYYGSWFFRRHVHKRDYLNSGVLLLNLEQIRATGLFQKCRERCRTMKMFMPDQSAINKLSDRKKILPRKYNEQRKLKNDTVFQHFSTSFRVFPWIHTVNVKPWDLEGMHNVLKLYEYDDLLEDYCQTKERYKGVILL